MLLLLNSNLSSSGPDYDMGADLHALRLLINPESQTNPQQIAGTLPNFLRWFHYELSGNTAAPTANVPSSSTQSLHELVRQLKLNSDTIKTAPGKIDTANTRLQTIATLLRALTNEVASSSTVNVTNPVTLNVSVTNHVQGSFSPDVLAEILGGQLIPISLFLLRTFHLFARKILVRVSLIFLNLCPSGRLVFQLLLLVRF